MKSKLLTFLMTALMIVVFIPTFSFAAETHGDAGASAEQTQEDPELLFCEGDINPDARQIVETRGTKALSDERRAAHTRLRELMDGHGNTDYYRNTMYYKLNNFNFTDEEISIMASVAEEATANCTTDYEAIKAIYELVAESVYYDYDAINGIRPHTDYCYAAWVSKTTICSGYSQICAAFLNSLGIPCVFARGDAHAYNVAYDSQQQRWIFFDATWGSKNKYRNGEMIYGGHTNTYFDMSVNYISSLSNHEFFGDLHMLADDKGCLEYTMQAPNDVTKWPDINLWEMQVYTLIDKNAEEVNIPAELFEMPVVCIRNNAFQDRDNLKSVTMPDSITSIGISAFEGCSSLEGIVIPDGVNSIGSDAFEGCSSMESANIPEGVTAIRDDTFFNCESLTSITIPDGVTSIGFRAFSKCESLTGSIIIPGSVKTVGSSAFYHCSSLESVTMENGVTSINSGAFTSCSSLESVTFPDSLISIASQAFFGCNSLTSIIIPDGVTSLGGHSFTNCTALESVTFPNSITSIPNNLFSGCNSLDNITIPDGVVSIGEYAFNSCRKLSKITVPPSVTSIGTGAFNGNKAVCIYCKKYSYAHSYAVENNINYNLWISLQDCDISIDKEEYHTTGMPIKPEITVMDEDVVLVEGRHYDVLTSDAVVGESSITIKGLGDYTDEVVITFMINDHDWDEEYTVEREATCTEDGVKSIHCSGCDATKDETAIPAAGHDWIHVIDEPGLLQNGLEYDKCSVCETTQNEVELPGYANYYVKSLKVTGKTKSINATWTKRSASVQKKFNGYEVRYATKADMSNAKTVTAKKSSKSKTIKNLKKNKKYYVQVRTFTKKDGTTFYSKWSKKNSVKTK